MQRSVVVAKLHKIAERIDAAGRRVDKDALDILRLLRAVTSEAMADGIRTLLSEDIAADVSEEAPSFLRICSPSPLGRDARLQHGRPPRWSQRKRSPHLALF